MTQRITDKDLQAVVNRINGKLKTPTQPYAQNADGSHTAQIGCYHLSWDYDGVCLHQITNLGGGCRTVVCGGHVTKRQLYEMMHAFISGLDEREVADSLLQRAA